MVECTKPLYDMLLHDTFNWIPCAAAEHSGGVLVVGFFLYAALAAIMVNWTESWVMPVAWTAIFAGVVIPFVPAPVVARMIAIVTLIVAASVIYLWNDWRD